LLNAKVGFVLQHAVIDNGKVIKLKS
jgi:hypothetical protein